MAFRIEKTVGGLIVLSALATGQTFDVRHRHLHGGGRASLAFTETGVRFEDAKHRGEWTWANLQRLELAPGAIRMVTYEDSRRQLGRDVRYEFDQLPEDAAARLYPLLAGHLDQRFVARIAIPPAGAVVWESPAKMLARTAGSNGTLKLWQGGAVFEGAAGSRTWRLSDIENIASAGPFEFSITSLDGEARFQLKRALTEDRYNELWRRFIKPNKEIKHEEMGTHVRR